MTLRCGVASAADDLWLTNMPESLSPADLALIGARFRIPDFRMEELVSLYRQGASDDEMLTSLRAPSPDDPQHAEPIDLTEAEASVLLRDLARLLG
jgi:hypothetical protein